MARAVAETVHLRKERLLARPEKAVKEPPVRRAAAQVPRVLEQVLPELKRVVGQVQE